jgi:hypothetical protein
MTDALWVDGHPGLVASQEAMMLVEAHGASLNWCKSASW